MRILLIALSVVYVFTPCRRNYFEHGKIRPIQVRIPNFNAEEIIETEQEEFVIKVKEGDCLSHIVAWCLNEYLRSNGHQGLLKFKETLYDIVNSIKTRSHNPDLIYPGEVISFKLPKTLKLFKFDYYRQTKQIYGMDTLGKLIDFYWLIEYNDQFDCSQRSAFVEYYLENEGFRTDIVCSSIHSWCAVEVHPDLWIDVECVSSPPETGSTIGHYDVRYENIYEAFEDSPDEFDWWNAIKEGKIIGKKQK